MITRIFGKTAIESDACDQREVCLGLSAPRREPEQVQNTPVLVTTYHRRRRTQEQEPQLERTPAQSPMATSRVVPRVLKMHGIVRQLECSSEPRIDDKQFDRRPNTLQRRVALLQMRGCDGFQIRRYV